MIMIQIVYVVVITFLVLNFIYVYKNIKNKEKEKFIDDLKLVTIYESTKNKNFGSFRIGDFQIAWGIY